MANKTKTTAFSSFSYFYDFNLDAEPQQVQRCSKNFKNNLLLQKWSLPIFNKIELDAVTDFLEQAEAPTKCWRICCNVNIHWYSLLSNSALEIRSEYCQKNGRKNWDNVQDLKPASRYSSCSIGTRRGRCKGANAQEVCGYGWYFLWNFQTQHRTE